ncbi:MAG: divalent-cation tolerance protein CutA [Candidatus Omnitrophota bacterium]
MHIIIFVTVKDKRQARKISSALLENKLAACVNISGSVDSLFFWRGKAERAKEFLLLIKSRKEKFKSIVKLVSSLHSYEVPEIVAVPVISGNGPYLRWIDASLGQSV